MGLSMMVSYMLPEIHEQVESVGITMDMICADHLLTLSANTLPLNAVVRLWDVALMEGSAALLASFLALLQLYLPEAVAKARAARPNGLEAPMMADVTTYFRELVRAGASRDIDEVMYLSLKFVPLLRGEGKFLELLRSTAEGIVCAKG
eukprot:NODE_3955_length_724_cov_327.884903.p2 GENE.NODE_3955_length_724_cov_327.884903~~NODE_3955_length_724_cov_327.884903.p2  ORF type:complete len:149 (+),score=59.63 NODE_3955_length_724_cov_327.884903:3-449(+)